MQGGRIIGEGVDGCILTEPMWPCSSETDNQFVPDLESRDYISKIVPRNDSESLYRKSAERLLGPLATKFMTTLKSECTPADPKHVSKKVQEEIYKSSEDSLTSWKSDGEACSQLKDVLKKKGEIASTHKIMYITRYLMNVKEWMQTTRQPMSQILSSVIPAIRPFLGALQRLYQQPSEQLIHIDMHAGNIFIKLNPLQFGLTDFGHCLLRRSSDTQEAQIQSFIGKYVYKYVTVYIFYLEHSVVPLEARLLNYCFMHKKEDVSPISLVREWEFEVNKIKRGSKDLLVMELTNFLDNLLKSHSFILMVEHIQKISRKIRIHNENPVQFYASLTKDEITVLEYILTRYIAISPVNTIAQAIMTLDSSSKESKFLIQSYFKKKPLDSNVSSTKLKYLTDYISQMIMAPYNQLGSSFSATLKSIQGMDIGIVWDDIVRS
jgi:hypothetical protein